MRDPACKECDRLWDEYANATFKRLRAQNAVDMAKALYAEDAAIQSLRGELEQVMAKIERIHRAIANHEAAAHDGLAPRESTTKTLKISTGFPLP